jgi:hypothetical protein
MAVHRNRLGVDHRLVPRFAILGFEHELVLELLEGQGRGERVDEITARQLTARVEREELDAARTRRPQALRT